MVMHEKKGVFLLAGLLLIIKIRIPNTNEQIV